MLFNKDFNYKGADLCASSTAIRAAPPLGEPMYVETRESEEVERARAALLEVLGLTRLPGDRCGDLAVNHPKYTSTAVSRTC